MSNLVDRLVFDPMCEDRTFRIVSRLGRLMSETGKKTLELDGGRVRAVTGSGRFDGALFQLRRLESYGFAIDELPKQHVRIVRLENARG